MSNSKFLLVTSPVHGKEVLLGFVPDSGNVKTGPTTNIFILHPDQDPLQTSKEGLDDRVCGSCPLRHSLGGACYVTLFQGPLSLYRGWERGGKVIDDPVDVLALVLGKKVRFGSYGDPAHIPAWLASEIMSASSGWTAYTHQWRNPLVSDIWKGKAMASCDTASQLRLAESQGWAGFVATPEVLQGVLPCLNETHGTQCVNCMKCNGAHGSVSINPHGARMNSHPSMPGKAAKKTNTK